MTRITSSTRPQARALLAPGAMRHFLLASAAAALFAGVMPSSPAQAYEANRADIKELSFTTQNIDDQWIGVVASNGMGWDTILPSEVRFGAHVNIDTRHHGFWHGVVKEVGLVLGPCGESSCAGKPLLWNDIPMSKDYENQMEVRFPTTKIPVSSGGGIATVHHGDEIIALCNEGTPGQEHTFDYLMQTTFVADTFQVDVMSQPNVYGKGEQSTPEKWYGSADHSLIRYFKVKVRCKAHEPASSGVQRPPENPHRTKVAVQDIDLFLSTYAIPNGAQRGPSGTQCKPLKVTTRIGTDKAGPVNAKLWRQVNGGPITSETKAMDAEALGSGKFGDDWDKFEHFTQTTTVQYKAEILGGTFSPSTQWKSITIHCNGDYAPTPNTSNPDSGPPPRGQPKAELPPAVVTPPPACGTKAAKVSGSAPCIKTAQLPDKRKDLAEQKRKQAERREAARQAQLRRDAARETAMQREIDMQREMNANAAMRPPLGMHRPHPFGRPIVPTTPGRAHGQFGVGIMIAR